MIKNIIPLLTIFFSINSFTQDNVIVTLYDTKGKVTKDPLKARVIQKLTKENDSLWLFSRFRRNNQLAAYWYSKTKDSKNKIGQMVTIDINDSISSIVYYNKKSEKHGKFSSWFDNRNLSFEGRYIKGKREGVWRQYYYTGELAAKAFFKSDSLLQQKYYDKKGNEKELEDNCCRKKPMFKGGIKKYKRIVQKFVRNLKYKIKGSITVDYTISITGDLTNVRIYDSIPEELSDEIITFFKTIKGWEPAYFAGRKIPMQNSFRVNFK